MITQTSMKIICFALMHLYCTTKASERPLSELSKAHLRSLASELGLENHWAVFDLVLKQPAAGNISSSYCKHLSCWQQHPCAQHKELLCSSCDCVYISKPEPQFFPIVVRRGFGEAARPQN